MTEHSQWNSLYDLSYKFQADHLELCLRLIAFKLWCTTSAKI